MRSMLMGGASPFAHLSGLGRRRRGARADDAPADDDKDKDAARRARADDSDDEDKDDDKGARAEEGDDERKDDARADEGDDDDKTSRRARADGDEDDEHCEDDDDEMRGKSAAAVARRRERSRCAAIIAAASGPDQIDLACRLAFKTSLPRGEAIAALKDDGGARAARPGSGRQARNPDLGTGGARVDPKQAMTGLWDKALKGAHITPRA